MSEPIFTPEAPAAAPRKGGLSNPAKVAIGCGFILMLGMATCAGGLLYCGKRVSSVGSHEWEDLQRVANDLGSDSGAKAEYASHPGLAATYTSAQDFVDETRQWRKSLEPLPAQMPSLLSGKISMHSEYANGRSTLVLDYRLASGRTLEGTWHNDTLADLQLR